jgi:hypothetical protein
VRVIGLAAPGHSSYVSILGRLQPAPRDHLTAYVALVLAATATCASGCSSDGSTWEPVDSGDDSGDHSGYPADGPATETASESGAGDTAQSETPDTTPSSGDDAAPDATGEASVTNTASPYDWVGIVGTGQSLSVGGGGSNQQTPISTTGSAHGLKLQDNGPDPKYPIAPNTGSPQWQAIPLSEPIRHNGAGQGPGYTDGQYPNDIQGETPHTAMADTLADLFSARGGVGDYVSVHSVVGWAGMCLDAIDKEGGQRAYPASLNEARVWQTQAAAAGKTFGYGGVVLTHGECDASNAHYGTGLYQFWTDYNADLKAITGQSQDVVLLASQQSTIDTGATGSAVQVWQASVAHPNQIVCAGPKYQYQYGPDLLHLPAPGYVRLGEKYAEILDIVVNQQRPWAPVQPKKIVRSGVAITVDFDVPNPPLVWDTVLAPPHQQAHSEWAKGQGFEVSAADGTALAIADATIAGQSVVITLTADPGAGMVQVGYALTQDGNGIQGGTVQGLRGLLRDSDDFEGSDAEDIDTVVTQGSTSISSGTPGAFVHRTSGDLLTGSGVPAATAIAERVSNDQLTLAAPWSNASGTITVHYHHNQANYCVHFAMAEGSP